MNMDASVRENTREIKEHALDLSKIKVELATINKGDQMQVGVLNEIKEEMRSLRKSIDSRFVSKAEYRHLEDDVQTVYKAIYGIVTALAISFIIALIRLLGVDL